MPSRALRPLFLALALAALAAGSGGGCASSGEEWTCCPTGGDCDRYYTGGSIPAGAPITQCEVLADVPPTAKTNSKIDGHGCVVVDIPSAESCLVHDTGPLRDDGPEAEAATDASDADASDATDADAAPDGKTSEGGTVGDGSPG